MYIWKIVFGAEKGTRLCAVQRQVVGSKGPCGEKWVTVEGKMGLDSECYCQNVPWKGEVDPFVVSVIQQATPTL